MGGPLSFLNQPTAPGSACSSSISAMESTPRFFGVVKQQEDNGAFYNGAGIGIGGGSTIGGPMGPQDQDALHHLISVAQTQTALGGSVRVDEIVYRDEIYRDH